MDDIINEWNAELERRSRSFVKHAEALAQASAGAGRGRAAGTACACAACAGLPALPLQCCAALLRRRGTASHCPLRSLPVDACCCACTRQSPRLLRPAAHLGCACTRQPPRIVRPAPLARLQWDSAILSNRHALLELEEELRRVVKGQESLEKKLQVGCRGGAYLRFHAADGC